VDGQPLPIGARSNSGIVGLGRGEWQSDVGVYVDGAFDAAAEFMIDITGYYAS
jgi:hypothetical protein